MIHVAANSTNTTTHQERRSRNSVRVHAITRKKEALDQSKYDGSRKISRHLIIDTREPYIIKIPETEEEVIRDAAQHGMKEHGKTQEDMSQMQSNLRAATYLSAGKPLTIFYKCYSLER